MDNYLNDAPAKRKADEQRHARTMAELRALYGMMEPTQPIELEERAKSPLQRMVDWLRRVVSR